MSSKTSSRSTLTTVPSTMSPSLKYLMVSSIAARKASCDPMSLTATLGVGLACVLLVMCWLAPADRIVWGRAIPGARQVGPQGALDLAGRPGEQRRGLTAARNFAWPRRTAPENGAALRIGTLGHSVTR